ncbi:MAG: ArsB/NhaD family transporter, partial [Metallibacterium scheffleri]
LTVLLIAYFVTAAYAVPVSVVTGLAALMMLALAGRWWRGGQGARIDVRGVIKHAPWQIVLFSLGMYLVVYGLRNAGLTTYLAQVLRAIGRHGVLAAVLGTGFISAGLSAVMNNMPTVLIGALGIHHAQGMSEPVREAMVYANVIGCDLGPKFTPIGSLATLLWLHVLARKGTRITWGYYFRVGLVLTTPVLLLTLLALAARLMPG